MKGRRRAVARLPQRTRIPDPERLTLMPHRYLVVAIVLFWMGMTGWMLEREILPWFGPGQPPPYAIDLAEEAGGKLFERRWQVFKDGVKKGRAETGVRYVPADDTYELHGLFKFWSGGMIPKVEADQVIKSMYRVTRDGELREVQASVMLTTLGVEARIEGRVQNGRLTPHVEVRASAVKWIERDLDPVEVAPRGSVLNPMQPLNRIVVHKGQHWRMPLVDPLADALRAARPFGDTFGNGREIRWLDAEVLPDTHWFDWGDGAEKVRCLVIEYRGDDISAHTWVRLYDGLVLQQEVTRNGEQLSLVRDDKP